MLTCTQLHTSSVRAPATHLQVGNGLTQVSGLTHMETAQSLMGTEEKRETKVAESRRLLLSWRSSVLSIVFCVFLIPIELEQIVFDVFFPPQVRHKKRPSQNVCT